MKTKRLLLPLIAGFAIVNLSQRAQSQPAPPAAPIPFEMNTSFLSGTVLVGAPVFYVGTNANSAVAPATVIAPITFTGTVQDVDNITYSYSRRTKLWSVNFVPGTLTVASSTILSNVVVGDTDGDGESLDTALTGWTFGSEIMQDSGMPMEVEAFKIVNNVVVRREPVPALSLTFMGDPALRTGTIGFNSLGEIASLNASAREPVEMQVNPEAYTTADDPDAVFFYLSGIFSNTLTIRTNTWTEPGIINTNIWFSSTGTAGVQGLGN